MKVVICSMNSKFVHAALAPWCLKSGLTQYEAPVEAVVVEPTVNQPLGESLQMILAHEPQLVGFCCYIWNIEKVLSLCGALKALDPAIKTVLGGPEVSCRAEEILEKYPQVDQVIEGPGEYAFAQVCKGEQKVPGVHSRNGSFVPPIPLPQPPLSPFTEEYYAQLNGRMAYIETSRGCPFQCAFCLSGNREAVTFFDLETCLKDLSRLAQSGVKTIKLVDRTFNCRRERSQAIWKYLIAQHAAGAFHDVCFHFEVGADLFNEEDLAILNSAPKGLFQVEAGLQSFHGPALDACGRHTDMQKLVRNLKALLAPGNLHVHIDLIAGLPHEDFETFRRSFDQAFALRPHMLQLGFLKLLYGSRLRAETEQWGYRFTPYPPYEILQNRFITYAELQALKRAEAALDAYYNTGRFPRSLEALLESHTPYQLFQLLGDRMARDAGTPAPAKLALYLYEMGGAALRDAIALDLTCQGEKLPKFLQIDDPRLAPAFNQAQTAYPKGRLLGRCMLYDPPRLAVADLPARDPVTRQVPVKIFEV